MITLKEFLKKIETTPIYQFEVKYINLQFDKVYSKLNEDNEVETQDTAIQKMSEHFALGNTILNAYKNSTLHTVGGLFAHGRGGRKT